MRMQPKVLMLVGTLSLFSLIAAAPAADALFVKKWTQKVSSAVKKVVDKGAKAVQGAAVKLGNKASAAASKALDAAGSVVKNTMDRFAAFANKALPGASAKVQKWLETKGNTLADKLPGVLGDLVKKGVKLGQGGLKKIEAALTAKLDGILGKGKGLVDAGVAKGHELIAQMKKSLMERVKTGIAIARDVLHGRVDRKAGQIAARFKGFATKYSGLVRKVKKGLRAGVKAVARPAVRGKPPVKGVLKKPLLRKRPGRITKSSKSSKAAKGVVSAKKALRAKAIGAARVRPAAAKEAAAATAP